MGRDCLKARREEMSFFRSSSPPPPKKIENSKILVWGKRPCLHFWALFPRVQVFGNSGQVFLFILCMSLFSEAWGRVFSKMGQRRGAPHKCPFLGGGKKERRERGLSCKKRWGGSLFKKGAPLQLQVETHTEFAKKKKIRGFEICESILKFGKSPSLFSPSLFGLDKARLFLVPT